MGDQLKFLKELFLLDKIVSHLENWWNQKEGLIEILKKNCMPKKLSAILKID